MSTTFLNLTPHILTVYGKNGELVLAMSAGPAEQIARAQQSDVKIGSLEVPGGHVVEVVRTTFSAPVNLPEPQEGIYLFVSLATAQAAKASGRKTDDLLLPSDPIRDEAGKIIGCRKFAIL